MEMEARKIKGKVKIGKKETQRNRKWEQVWVCQEITQKVKIEIEIKEME